MSVSEHCHIRMSENGLAKHIVSCGAVSSVSLRTKHIILHCLNVDWFISVVPSGNTLTDKSNKCVNICAPCETAMADHLFWQHDTLNHVKRTERSFYISFLFSFLFFFYYFFGFCTIIFISILWCTHSKSPWTQVKNEKTEILRVKKNTSSKCIFFSTFLLCVSNQCCLLSIDVLMVPFMWNENKKKKKKLPSESTATIHFTYTGSSIKVCIGGASDRLQRNKHKCAASWIAWAFNYKLRYV